MKMKKFIAVLSVASMMAVAAAGCGSSSDTSAQGDGAASTDEGSSSEWDAASAITVVSRKVPEQEERSQSCSVLWMKTTMI